MWGQCASCHVIVVTSPPYTIQTIYTYLYAVPCWLYVLYSSHMYFFFYFHTSFVIGVCRPAVSRQQSAPTLVFRCVPCSKARQFSLRFSAHGFSFSYAYMPLLYIFSVWCFHSVFFFYFFPYAAWFTDALSFRFYVDIACFWNVTIYICIKYENI